MKPEERKIIQEFSDYLKKEIETTYNNIEDNWFWSNKIQELTDEWLNQ